MENNNEKKPRNVWYRLLYQFILQRITSVCAVILVAAVLLWYFCIHAPSLIISEATTRITEPLTADGRIDFFKALEKRIYPPELATDENGFRLFVRDFGDVGEAADSEYYRLQKYEKLGLDPNIPPTLVLPKQPHSIIEDFYKAEGQEFATKQADGIRKPWTLEQYPMLADWIHEVDVPLDAFAEMIRKPVFFPPLLQSEESVQSGNPQNLISLILPDYQIFRDVARMLQARATYRIGQGNIEGAIDDKLTAHRLGRLITSNGSAVQYLVGLAIDYGAVSTPVNANSEYPLTATQIRRILEGLDSLPPRESLRNLLECERYVVLDSIQEIARNRAYLSTPDLTCTVSDNPWWLATYLPCDWNIVYRRANEMYDALQIPSRRTEFYTLSERYATTSTFGKLCRLFTAAGRGEIVSDLANGLLAIVFDAVEEATRRCECSENMQRLVLAMLLYQLEHGKLSDENWAVQIEKYLGESPERYFSCPTNPSLKGETTYALVQYGDDIPESLDTLLLIELSEPVPLDKAVISVDEVLERLRTSNQHHNGMNTAYRSGAMRFLSSSIEEEELLRLLGRKVETNEQE